MFHHFHNSKHPAGQGAISGDEFEEMIDWLSIRYNLLSAHTYLEKMQANKLLPLDICLSFDDALLCQADIAVPILNKRDIQAFFFVYSSPFVGDPEPLEIYRYFRTVQFENVDEFYSEFFTLAHTLYTDDIIAAKQTYDASSYLSAFPFYTENDKWFRFIRDYALGKEKYDKVMTSLMEQHLFDRQAASTKLWMNDNHIRQLSDAGHVVGLHSYSHPTMIHMMSDEEQEKEYIANFEHLKSVLGFSPFAMSHPCGHYNEKTLEILRKLGVKIGFRSNSSITSINSALEIPREDHADVMRQMKS